MASPATLPLGMALWLLRGGTLADRVAWIAAHGFQAVSLLQQVIDVDPVERAEAAAAIRAAGLLVTYHGPLTVEVCVDILRGRYAADIHHPAETTPILQTRDVLRLALQSGR